MLDEQHAVTMGPDADGVAGIVRGTLAYASGVSEALLTDATRLFDLGIDSVSTMACGVVLEAELGIPIGPQELTRIFNAATVADAIATVRELIAASWCSGGPA